MEPAGRQHGQHGDRGDRGRRQQPQVRPGAAPDREQAEADADRAEGDRGVDDHGHRHLRGVQRQPQRRLGPGPRDQRDHGARPGHRYGDHEQHRDRDGDRGDPAEKSRTQRWRGGPGRPDDPEVRRAVQRSSSLRPARARLPPHPVPCRCCRRSRLLKLLEELNGSSGRDGPLTRSLLSPENSFGNHYLPFAVTWPGCGPCPGYGAIPSGPDRADGVDGVGLGRALVGPVPQHAGEPEGQAARVAAAGLHPVERDLHDQFGTDPDDAVSLAAVLALGPVAAPDRPGSSSRVVCQASISSVRPLKVLPSMTRPPVSGSRAPRCRLDSTPRRRPCPHSAASTTRSSVCRGLTLIHSLPRRPARYGESRDFRTTPFVTAGDRVGQEGLGRRRVRGHDARDEQRRPARSGRAGGAARWPARRSGRRRPGAAGRTGTP